MLGNASFIQNSLRNACCFKNGQKLVSYSLPQWPPVPRFFGRGPGKFSKATRQSRPPEAVLIPGSSFLPRSFATLQNSHIFLRTVRNPTDPPGNARNFGAEAFEKSVFCHAPLKKRTDVGKQKHPAMTPYPQGAWKCSKSQNDPSEATLLDGSGRSSKLGFLTGPSPLIGVNFASLRSVFWRFGARRLKKQIKRCVTVEKTQKSFETAEKTDKSCVTLEKTHPWKRTWSPKAVSSQSWIFESIKKLREVESIFFPAFLASPGSRMRSLWKKQTKGASRSKKRRNVSRRVKKHR